jgi:hypothetical protein
MSQSTDTAMPGFPHLLDVQLCQGDGNSIVQVKVEQVVNEILDFLFFRLGGETREAFNDGRLQSNSVDLCFVLSRQGIAEYLLQGSLKSGKRSWRSSVDWIENSLNIGEESERGRRHDNDMLTLKAPSQEYSISCNSVSSRLSNDFRVFHHSMRPSLVSIFFAFFAVSSLV